MYLLLRTTFWLALITLFAPSNAFADGKDLFNSQGCPKCHGISSLSLKTEGDAPDLSHIGTKHTAEWMEKFLLKEEALEGKKHKKKFPGTPEELKQLTQWLATLK